MKIKLLLVFIFFGLNQLMAQNKSKLGLYKQPKGFVFVPKKGNNSAFYVMEEPVKKDEFKKFINWLYEQGRMIDANTCVLGMPEDTDPRYPYVMLSNIQPILLYAEYLSKKLSNDSFNVSCKLISENQWKQMLGPEDGQVPIKKNPFGIKYVKDICEWKLNSKKIGVTYTDINGYQRSTFRLMLTYISKSQNIK
jgi:hypothetical protein